MIDITEKKVVERRAVASGRIVLREESISAIAEGKTKKGDVLGTARTAAVMAVKRTPEIIPFCHQIPITDVKVDFTLGRNYVDVKVEVKSLARTGVEMESLTGAAVALLTVWDMVKYIEKNASGNYPSTKISDLRVVKKEVGR
jgi:cyclic pyranopterin phosphate synthase